MKVGDIIFEAEAWDNDSYYTLLIIDEVDDKFIIKDFSWSGRTFKREKKFCSMYKTENEVNIKISDKIRKEQLNTIREFKLKTLLK